MKKSTRAWRHGGFAAGAAAMAAWACLSLASPVSAQSTGYVSQEEDAESDVFQLGTVTLSAV